MIVKKCYCDHCGKIVNGFFNRREWHFSNEFTYGDIYLCLKCNREFKKIIQDYVNGGIKDRDPDDGKEDVALVENFIVVDGIRMEEKSDE